MDLTVFFWGERGLTGEAGGLEGKLTEFRETSAVFFCTPQGKISLQLSDFRRRADGGLHIRRGDQSLWGGTHITAHL